MASPWVVVPPKIAWRAILYHPAGAIKRRSRLHPRRADLRISWSTSSGRIVMKFMLTFSIKPETKARDEAIARFKATGGQPPKGVRLVGRWTAADFSGGFDLLESDDAKALTEFALMWSDLMELRIAPVLDDSDLGEVLKARK
jgi:hypothetical protein